MDSLLPFVIPVSGLHLGIHEFKYDLGDGFFSNFEGSPIQSGRFSVQVTFEKHSDFFEITFDFDGTVRTECDRCLEMISLPISGHERLLVKFAEEETEEEADLVFVNPGIIELNIARFIYEYIALALPLVKVYDCENDPNAPCNPEMLKFIADENSEEVHASNPLADVFKNFSAN